MVDYNQIALFIEVIEAGSLSEAARRLNYSKSNLSRTLSQLEKVLGTQLVIRNTRHFRPTEAGIDFYRRCKDSFSLIKNTAQSMREEGQQLKGKLTITVAVDFALTVLPPIATRFCEQHPHVELEVRGEDRYVDLVKEGVDLALRFGKLNDSSLKALKICDTRLVFVASPQYLVKAVKPKTPGQLSEHKIISFHPRFENDFNIRRRNGRLSKIRLKPFIRVNNPLIAKAFVLAGRGIALVPDMMCGEEIKSGALVRVLPEFSTEDSPFHFVWPGHMTESPKIRSFIEFSREQIRRQVTV